MPQLDPTWYASQLFWLCITFIALYVIISRIFLPPLMKIMGERKTVIATDIEQSEQLSQQAAQAKEAYEAALAGARLKSRQLIDVAMAEQQAKTEKAMADLQEKINEKLADAEKRMAGTREKLLSELSQSTGEMAKAIAQKMTN